MKTLTTRDGRAFLGKRGGNVILASVCLSLIVDPREVVVRSVDGAAGWFVLLEPKSKFHMIAQELRPDLLVVVEHDPAMMTASQATAILS